MVATSPGDSDSSLLNVAALLLRLLQADDLARMALPRRPGIRHGKLGRRGRRRTPTEHDPGRQGDPLASSSAYFHRQEHQHCQSGIYIAWKIYSHPTWTV